MLTLVRLRFARPLIVLLVLAAAGAGAPGGARAGGVLVLDHGRVHPSRDPVLRALPEEPAMGGRTAFMAAAAGKKPERKPRVTLAVALRRLRARNAIPPDVYIADRSTLTSVRRAWRGLRGTRRAQLGVVLDTADAMAARGAVTPSRLAELFLTLERNRQWWTTGPLLAPGERVAFAGSRLVWEHYAGEGIQLHVLGTFGAANGWWQAHEDGALRQTLDEMIPLAAHRAGGIAWEYLFPFGGGSPPWASGMAQATGIQALARASVRLKDPALLRLARRALPLFEHRAPSGVRVPTRRGAHYLLYSFAPGVRVINGFVQAVNGLHDLAALGGGAEAERLYRQGEREARFELPRFDTGAWSLYSNAGDESDLSYHVLLRDFLTGLCGRSGQQIYCRTAARFTADLHHPPATAALTKRVRAGRHGLLRFRVSKVSRVGLTVRRAGRVVFATSATVGHGAHAYSWTAPRGRGAYELTIFARDLAGNAASTVSPLRVTK